MSVRSTFAQVPASVAEARVEIRPVPDLPGFKLTSGNVSIWFAREVHAINYAQDTLFCSEIVVYDAAGNIVHRYSPTSNRTNWKAGTKSG